MAQWFEYEWTTREGTGEYAVDLSFLEHQPAGYETLLYLTVRSQKEGEPLKSSHQARAERLLAKVQKALQKAVFVGSILFEDELQYYFYTRQEGDLLTLETLADKARGLFTSCGRLHDPGFQTYLTRLYPDAARYQTVENQRMLALLQKQGDDLARSRRVRLYAFFPTEPCRLLFQEEARLIGFALGDPLFEPDQELPYGITLLCITPLVKKRLDAITTEIIRAAARQGGELSGWDCAVVPKRHPLK